MLIQDMHMSRDITILRLKKKLSLLEGSWACKVLHSVQQCAKRSWPFWDVTQRILVDSCGRFGTTYWSHLQGSNEQMYRTIFLSSFTFENGTNRLSRNVWKLTTSPRRVMSQKSEDIIKTAGVAWRHGLCALFPKRWSVGHQQPEYNLFRPA